MPGLADEYFVLLFGVSCQRCGDCVAFRYRLPASGQSDMSAVRGCIRLSLVCFFCNMPCKARLGHPMAQAPSRKFGVALGRVWLTSFQTGSVSRSSPVVPNPIGAKMIWPRRLGQYQKHVAMLGRCNSLCFAVLLTKSVCQGNMRGSARSKGAVKRLTLRI